MCQDCDKISHYPHPRHQVDVTLALSERKPIDIWRREKNIISIFKLIKSWNDAHLKRHTIVTIVGKNLNPYEHMTYGMTFVSNFECFFPVARFIISGAATLFTNVVEINGTTIHIKYTDVNGVRIGGNANIAHIVFIRARLHPQHTQNYIDCY